MSEPEYIILDSKKDFYWYKKRLDLDREYDHDHDGKPVKYPCGVESSLYDDPSGPHAFGHSFIYQQEITCSECGRKCFIWPDTF